MTSKNLPESYWRYFSAMARTYSVSIGRAGILADRLPDFISIFSEAVTWVAFVLASRLVRESEAGVTSILVRRSGLRGIWSVIRRPVSRTMRKFITLYGLC